MNGLSQFAIQANPNNYIELNTPNEVVLKMILHQIRQGGAFSTPKVKNGQIATFVTKTSIEMFLLLIPFFAVGARASTLQAHDPGQAIVRINTGSRNEKSMPVAYAVAIDSIHVMMGSRVEGLSRVSSVVDASGIAHAIDSVIGAFPETGFIILRLHNSLRSTSYPSVATFPASSIGCWMPAESGEVGSIRRIPISLSQESITTHNGRILVAPISSCGGGPIFDSSGRLVAQLNLINEGGKVYSWVAKITLRSWKLLGVRTDIDRWPDTVARYHASLTLDQKRRLAGIRRQSTCSGDTWSRTEIYDRNGRLIRLAISSGSLPDNPPELTQLYYDRQGRLSSLVSRDSGSPMIKQETRYYYPSKRITRIEEILNGGKSTTTRRNRPDGLPLSEVQVLEDPRLVLRTSWGYTLDKKGLVVEQHRETRDERNSLVGHVNIYFDSLGRIEREDSPGKSIHYEYDEDSNQIMETDSVDRNEFSIAHNDRKISGECKSTQYDDWGLPATSRVILNETVVRRSQYQYVYFP